MEEISSHSFADFWAGRGFRELASMYKVSFLDDFPLCFGFQLFVMKLCLLSIPIQTAEYKEKTSAIPASARPDFVPAARHCEPAVGG
jgi:hypothetical protein